MARLGALAAVVALVVTGCGDEATSTARDSATTRKVPTTLVPRELDAFDACKGFVKSQLKAPSTAKFRNFYEKDGEVLVTGTGDGPYTVTSTVDSQNSFGAKLRSSFTCTVTLTGSTWGLDDISIV